MVLLAGSLAVIEFALGAVATRPATQPSVAGAVARTLTFMDESRQRLSVGLDPGPQTQAVQQRIVLALDDVIAAAMANTPVTSGTSGQPRTGEPRQSRPAGLADKAPGGAEKPAGPVQGRPGEVQSDGTGLTTPAGEFRESRRGWGHLPPRERDEIIQGVREAVLEKYREQVNDYYRALAEEGDE